MQPMTRFLAAAGRRTLDVLLPPICPITGELVDWPGLRSAAGWSQLKFIDDPVCARCGAPFAHDHGDGAECAACIAEAPAFDRARAAVVYDDASHKLIVSFKHSDRTELAPLLGGWLARAGGPRIGEGDPRPGAAASAPASGAPLQSGRDACDGCGESNRRHVGLRCARPDPRDAAAKKSLGGCTPMKHGGRLCGERREAAGDRRPPHCCHRRCPDDRRDAFRLRASPQKSGRRLGRCASPRPRHERRHRSVLTPSFRRQTHATNGGLKARKCRK